MNIQVRNLLPELLFFLLAVTALIMCINIPYINEVIFKELRGYAILLASLSLGVVCMMLFLPRWWNKCRYLCLSVTMLLLYLPTGRIGVLNQYPFSFDSFFDHIDAWLFGFDPSNWIQQFYSPLFLEYFSFCYAFFIPYIYLSLFLNLTGIHNPRERERFLTGFALLYFFSFCGYLFLPTYGPAAFPEAHHHLPLKGGVFLKMVMMSVEQTGGWLGAFPSLHVGASLYFCLSDFKRDKLRTLLFIPVLFSIIGATIILRCHYVVDLFAGALCSFTCFTLSNRLFPRIEGESN